MKKAFSKIEILLVCLLGAFFIVGMPLLHSTGAVSDYTLSVWGKYLCYALLAISVDLLWGYTGLLSLGQALFFSLGGYMLGMHLMLMIGKLGKYAQSGKNPNLVPDFMYFLGYENLVGFWKPFYSLGFALLMVVLLPGLLAAVFGWFAFLSRIKGVYFSILTQALTYAFSTMFLQNSLMMGGNNGFTDFKLLMGYDIRSPLVQRGLFIATAIAIVSVYCFCRWLTGTKFGLVQRAVRDSETRVLFSGYPVVRYKLLVFILSSLIASIGGALYVPQVGIINPGEMKTEKSLEAVVWCAVGGRGTLVGPVIGAVGVNALKSWAVREYPDSWFYMLGGMFILMVIFLPAGLVGLPAQIRALLARRRASADGAPPASSPQKPDLSPVAEPATTGEASA